MQKEKKENKKSVGEGITEFLQKNRKFILVTTAILVIAFIGSIVSFYIIDVQRKKAILTVEELGIRYETIQEAIQEKNSQDISQDIFNFIDDDEDVAEDIEELNEDLSEEENDSKEAEIAELNKELDELLLEIEDFAKNNSGFAGSMAWWLIGRIYTEKEEWEKAEPAWASSADAAKETYLAPLAYFNAGIAAEQQGKTEQAIEYYTSSLSMRESFPDAQRAQFAIGRLYESLGDMEAANRAYTELILNKKYDTPWVNLAHSRLIMLEIAEQESYILDIDE